jgi:hypothetical protein
VRCLYHEIAGSGPAAESDDEPEPGGQESDLEEKKDSELEEELQEEQAAELQGEAERELGTGVPKRALNFDNGEVPNEEQEDSEPETSRHQPEPQEEKNVQPLASEQKYNNEGILELFAQYLTSAEGGANHAAKNGRT